MAATLDYVIFGLAPLMAILVMSLNRILENIDEIKDNWALYRCNPLYMPFVTLIQPEVSTSMNFNYCMGTMSKQVLKVPMDSIQTIMGTFLNTIRSLFEKLNVFRNLRQSMSKFMMSMLTMSMGKISNVTGSLVHVVTKILDVIKRMAGTGVVGMFMGKTLFLTLRAFWTLAISILRGFIIATIVIGIIVVLFTQVPLMLGLTLLAFFSAAGGFSTF